MNSTKTYSMDKIKNPIYYLNIELYKVLVFDILNRKILVKIYNHTEPVWLDVNCKSLSKNHYLLVSRGHIIGNSGITVSSEIINNRSFDIPKGMRKCYQCEFDEYIVENNLYDEAFTNLFVWKTVCDYLENVENMEK